MAHKLRHDLFVLVVCISLQRSFALASRSLADSPISSFHSLISASAAASSSPPYACYPPDRDALLDVAASFLNSSQRFPAHWGLKEQDCCNWEGVTCGSPFNSTTMTSTSSNSSANSAKLYHRRVVGVRLEGDDSATSSVMLLPLAICRLSALLSLDLSSNALSGPIPTCFSDNLTSLQTLILSDNSLSGSLSPLANLSLLTHLDLSDINPFTSTVQASSIIFSGNLTYLDLSHMGLSGALSALRLHTPSSLEYLDLSENSLSGSVVSFIKGLSAYNLQHLDLSSNYGRLNISLTPAAFSTSPLIQYLDLGENEEVTGDIRVLEHLQHLEKLTLMMQVPARSLGSLFCKLGSLQSISIMVDGSHIESTGSYGVLDELLCEKPASVNVTYLELEQRYTGPFPKWIAHFARLGFLSLLGNQFEGSIPQGWQALTQLNVLSLTGDSPLTSVSLSKEVQNWLSRLPLVYLGLSSMGLTSQDFPCAAFSLLNHTLQSLELSDNHISPGHALLHCLQAHNFSLILLSLSRNPLALSLQPHMFPVSIYVLDLSYCQLFGRLSGIGTLVPSATSIDLSHNNLTGSIPSNIGSTQIGPDSMYEVSIDLSHNKLTSIIPSSIWNLTAASPYSWLGLNDNRLHGELVFDQALTADGVSIANNYLSKVYFFNVSSLAFLDLSNNHLGGNLESLLGDYTVMKSMEVLLLHNNHLKGSIPISLGTSAPSLITLDLSSNTLIGAIPPSLAHLQALQSKLGEAPADTGFHYTLESVKNVEFNITYVQRGHLDLSCNKLSGTIPESLGALVGLNDLNLSRNQLSGPIPPSLAAHLASLESLDLSFNKLEGVIPSEFLKLTSLETFNVSFNPNLSGQIPEGPQLETATSYEGDQKLCGQAINKKCTSEQQIRLMPTGQQTDNTQQTLGFKKRFASFINGIEEWIAIPGIILGHALGMGITIWALKRLHFYK